MTMRVLTYNPAALVTLQRPARKPIAPLSAEQGRDLLTAAADHRLGALVISALMLGLRLGEVSGLAWDDVDLDTRTLRIRQQLQPTGDKRGHLARVPLKTLNSRRTLTLPALVVAALQAYRTGQRAERLKAGATWTHVDNLVFTTPQGRPVHPSQGTRRLPRTPDGSRHQPREVPHLAPYRSHAAARRRDAALRRLARPGAFTGQYDRRHLRALGPRHGRWCGNGDGYGIGASGCQIGCQTSPATQIAEAFSVACSLPG